jgi:hypothetical protein
MLCFIGHTLMENRNGLVVQADLTPANGNNLAPIQLAGEIDPDLPQVACFDTAFHRSHPTAMRCHALSTTKACAATGSTASPTSMSPSGCAPRRPTWPAAG